MIGSCGLQWMASALLKYNVIMGQHAQRAFGPRIRSNLVPTAVECFTTKNLELNLDLNRA
jgi:hypothetical protein